MALDWSRTVFGAEAKSAMTTALPASQPQRPARPRADSSALLSALVETVQKARDVDTREYEGMTVEQLSTDLVPIVGRIVEDGIAAIEALGTHFEQGTHIDGPDATRDDARSSMEYMRTMDGVVEQSKGVAAVADIAFLSGRMLKAKAKELSASIKRRDAWAVIGDCGSALRGLQKAASAVEAAACVADGKTPKLTYVSELNLALETRTTYTKLRAAIVVNETVDEGNIVSHMRTAATNIAKLVGRDIYGSLRLIDRVPLRELQHRMLNWLAHNASDLRGGVRIWQDCAGVVSLLRGVNHREELILHDRDHLEKLASALKGMRGDSLVMDKGFLAESWALFGRDDELDALIQEGPGSRADRWLAALERAQGALGAPAF